MAKYKPLRKKDLSINDVYQLEHYMFRLYEHMQTEEFIREDSETQRKIYNELHNVEHTVTIFRQLLSKPGLTKIVAWKRNDDDPSHKKLYCFTDIKVASLSTGTSVSSIKACATVLRDVYAQEKSLNKDVKKWSRNGWYYKYADDCSDFISGQIGLTQILKLENGKIKITPPDGDV